MTHARTLIDTLGAQAIAAAVGVDQRTVQNKGAARFPASWWLAVSALCERHGAPCPPEAFGFKGEDAA